MKFLFFERTEIRRRVVGKAVGGGSLGVRGVFSNKFSTTYTAKKKKQMDILARSTHVINAEHLVDSRIAQPDLENGTQFQVLMKERYNALLSAVGIACRSQDPAALHTNQPNSPRLSRELNLWRPFIEYFAPGCTRGASWRGAFA
jgi:hypothetical protein